ncbi:hypothetical protein C8Q75DRAFT_530421 [Abortiporus biennis]|nr:hypothetical protein C8Q75DRAFT_530421 [Abortiporus biennis]
MLDQGHLDSPRQRNEFLTAKSADGTSVTYSWKYYLSSQVGTSTHFFHLMQVFSDGQGEPVVTLDAVNGQLAIVDVARGCTTNKCPAVAISQFTDRTTLHTIKVTFGPNGKLNYAITNADTGASILSYSATGAMGSGGSYVKFGTYRATFAGMTAVNAVVGDFKSG